MYKMTMARVLPLAMTTGIPLKMLAAGEAGWRQKHQLGRGGTLREDCSYLHLHARV